MTQTFGFVGRRSLLKTVGALGLGMAVISRSPLFAQPSRKPSDQLTPDEALSLLMEGNKRFVSGETLHPRQGVSAIRDVAADQFPFAAFLSCADSRVPVEILFDQGLGDCFVCRVAGNVLTKEALGSLEFGTAVLGSRLIMVLGHERCGAIAAVFGRQELPATQNDIASLVPYIEPAVKTIQEQSAKAPIPDDVEEAIKLNVKNQVEALYSSVLISELVQKNEIKIVGAYYDLDTGEVSIIT
ncbi:carbonic anhydrase [Synechococcus sp. Nb3U1]|uniref:carbonic anhydrase n=1 Tax=Synechococcus sp. Nb3U1 TaxID=1914529 RepID=UPI001F485E0A|nr:carbonic anhydrase [Synechococcus sp. Nb3U1]MCF2970005.1 carbonic anhydrase [Synechococcus sp. Nb3U1]